MTIKKWFWIFSFTILQIGIFCGVPPSRGKHGLSDWLRPLTLPLLVTLQGISLLLIVGKLPPLSFAQKYRGCSPPQTGQLWEYWHWLASHVAASLIWNVESKVGSQGASWCIGRRLALVVALLTKKLFCGHQLGVELHPNFTLENRHKTR